MHARPYLRFDGNCAEAFEFYTALFGGKINAMMRWGDMPGGQIPPGTEQRVMHADLSFGTNTLLGADSMPGQYLKPQGFNISLELDNVSDVERVFAGLSEGGAVGMKLEQTFFAERFGTVTDRFGTPWMVLKQAG